jgi:hypothetical protein
MAHGPIDLDGGDGTGVGLGGLKPKIWTVWVDCSVTSPAGNAAVTGAEPGFQLTVTGTATAVTSLVNPDPDTDPGVEQLVPVVSLTVDGRVAAIAWDDSEDGIWSWSAHARIYRSGTVPISVTAHAAAHAKAGSHRFDTQIQVTLASEIPSMVVNAPAGGSAVRLGEAGGDVAVTVTMADANQFGAHAVTVLPDRGNEATLTPTPGSATQFTGTVHFPSMPLAWAITVTGACAGAPDKTNTVRVSGPGVDIVPPRVTVTHPAAAFGQVAAIPAASDPAPFTVSVSGTAEDAQSGMIGGQSSVAVALAVDGPRVTARPGRPDDWATWTVDALPLPPLQAPPTGSLGQFPLFVWGTDFAGNTTPAPLAWGLDAIRSWVPATLEERLSLLEYLRDLIAFTGSHVSWGPTTAAVPVSPDVLAAALGQPVDAISQPATPAAAAAQLPVNELRVPIEILRAQMAGQHITPGAAGQGAYLSAAYDVLLTGAGTSYTELRLARGADATQRDALAARIGIPLYGPAAAGAAGNAPGGRPDQLDALTLDGPALTEQALQDLFGLATTAPFDPQHVPPASTPRLLGWQLEAQRDLWQSQDAHPPVPVAYSVIVDPDVITARDVRADSPQSTQVLNLLAARSAQLTGQASALNAARAGAASAVDSGLSALLAAALPAGMDIAALHTQESQGTDIGSQLAAAGLDRTGFDYLLQLQALAGQGGALLTSREWADAVEVLVGAYRRRQYGSWSAADPSTGKAAEAGIVLSPDVFQLTTDPPPAGRLRIDPAARADWQATLRTRTIQRQALHDAMAQLVAAAERAALPVLRDALLADIAGPTGDPAAAGEQISGRYQIDVSVSGVLTTTRLDQAITSLQSLLQLVRSGEHTQIDALQTWTLTSTTATFDTAWAWIGTLDSWRSATTTFLFPEAALDPGMLAHRSPAAGSNSPSEPFTKLCDALAAGPGVDLSQAATGYVAGVQPLLRSLLGTDGVGFGYPDARDMGTQAALASLSGMLDGSVPHSGGTDPGLALEVFWAVPMLLAQRSHADGHYQAALDWLWSIFPYTDSYTDSGPVSIYKVINDEATTAATRPDLTLTDWTEFDPFTLITKPTTKPRPYPYLRATLLAIISCLLDYADSEFATETSESIAHARNLYRTAAGLLAHPRFEPVPPSDPGSAALPIPQLAVLRTRAANQLAKIRQDRNIAGLPRTQTVSSGDPIRQPTPYHFKVLLARAQQLAQQAATVEGEYLSALEKYDNKTLQLADAQNAATVAAAQLTVHDAQVQQAKDAVAAAQAQQAKEAGAVSTLFAAIAAPPNQYEQNLLNDYSDMRTAQDVIAGGHFVSAIGQALAAGASGSSTPWGAGMAGAAAGVEMAGASVALGGEIAFNEIQKSMQENQLRASIEDRRQQWRIQLASAQQDVLVAAAQVKTANDQVTIAQAESRVASLQADHAKATLDLLANQFTSPGMYRWLSDTLGGVYRYFLQQATAIARLAQAQLAFERAQPARVLIRSDYWQPLTAPPGGDARGLTGAERLAEDLSKLDQYAFRTDSRLLNVSQTFSLAALAPVEFIDFRNTGQLSVATPAALFDRDFPGHYQRLIRQVRLSVVALVPPARGIRATLASYGISRVTTAANGMFSEVLLRRDPSVVALTSPVDATGVFTVDLQPEMLLPFEGGGVDANWELTLPQAANPFDFRTISDVLLTIDYTALLDLDYQAQVTRRLNADRTRSADRVFSLSRDFPDQWYTLNNPDPPAQGRAVTLTLRDADFPPGITGLQTMQIAVRLSGTGPFPAIPVTVTRGGTSGAAMTDASGTASTRRGGAVWIDQFIGHSPVGDWQLSFDQPAEPVFTGGGLDDVLLMIGWSGTVPAWPA